MESSPMVDDAVASVLSANRLIARYPGARGLTELYPSPASSVTHLAETLNSRGRMRVTGNSLSLTGQTNFDFSSSSVLTNFQLHATLTTAANTVLQSGWLFNAIDTVQITFSNSQMQNVDLTGTAMREVLLLKCEDQEDRKRLLEDAGRLVTGAVAGAYASIPIGNLITLAIGVKDQHGIDMSTLSGQIKFTVRFTNRFFGGVGAVNVPANFDSLAMTADTADLLNGAFSVRNTLAAMPGASYNIATKWINAVPYTATINARQANNTTQINITSIPAGILEALVLIIKPTAELGTAPGAQSTFNPIGGSIRLKRLRLQYSGQNIIDAYSPSEIRSFMRSTFSGDDLCYEQISADFTGGNALTATPVKYVNEIICIPMGYNSKDIMSGHLHENLPSYSGANLTLLFQIDNTANRFIYRCPAAPDAENPYLIVAQPAQEDVAIPYTIEVIAIMSALNEITQGTVDLQL